MREPPPTALWSRPFATTLVATALFFGAFGLTLPVLPRFVVERLGGGDLAVGVVFASYAISAVLFRPWLGRLGDRRGRRRLLLLGCGVTALGLAGHLLATTLFTLIVARLVVGVGQAATMIAATTLALDHAPLLRRGEASSYVLVAIQVGVGIGPVAGELLADRSFELAWLGAAATCLLTGVLAATLPTPVPPSHLVPRGQPPERASLMNLHAGALRPGVLVGLGTFGFAGYLAFAPLYAATIGIERIALLFVLASGTVVVVRTLAAKLTDRLGARQVATASLVLLTIGFVLMGMWPAAVGLYAGTVVMASGTSLLAPALILAATTDTPEHERTQVMGTFTLFIDLATALGPGFLGVVAAVSNYRFAFLIAGTASAIGAWLVRRSLPRNR